MNHRPCPLDRILAAGTRAVTALPEPLLAAVARPPVNSAGERLDADVAASLRLLRLIGGGRGMTRGGLARGRRELERQARLAAGAPDPARVRDTAIAGVPVREYLPAGAAPRGAVVLLHGGGWAMGSPDSHDAPARRICRGAGARVVSVDYRLAPEHPHPAALDDAWAVYAELAADPAAGPVAVAGDSAGATLAAAVCLRARDRGLPQPALQALVAPVADLVGRSASRAEFARGFFLHDADLEWFYRARLGAGAAAADPADPEVSPLRAGDLRGLAPAYVAVAGFDPLRDEGLAYAGRLAAAGVPVALVRHRGLVHSFLNSTGIWRGARRAVDQLAGALRLALAGA